MLKVENINHNSCKEPVMKLVASQDGKMDEVEGGTLGTPFEIKLVTIFIVIFYGSWLPTQTCGWYGGM